MSDEGSLTPPGPPPGYPPPQSGWGPAQPGASPPQPAWGPPQPAWDPPQAVWGPPAGSPYAPAPAGFPPVASPARKRFRWWYAVLPLVLVVLVVGGWLLARQLASAATGSSSTGGSTPAPSRPSDQSRGGLSNEAIVSPTDLPVPTLSADGPRHVRFEIWAPGAKSIDVEVDTYSDQPRLFSDQSAPWAVEYDVLRSTEELSVYATSNGLRDVPMRCRITVDGIVVSDELGTSSVECYQDVAALYNR